MKYILILLVIMNVFISCGKQQQSKVLNENNSKFIAINFSNKKHNYYIENYKLSCKNKKFSDVIVKENRDNKLFYLNDKCRFIFTKIIIDGVHYHLQALENNMLSLSQDGEMIQVTTSRDHKKEIYYVKTKFNKNTKIITVSVYPKNIDINKNYFEYKMHEPKVGSDEIENLIRNKYAQIKKDPRVDENKNKKPLESLLKMVLSKGGDYNSIAAVYSSDYINQTIDDYIKRNNIVDNVEDIRWSALLYYLKYDELLKILQDLLGKKKNILHLSVKIPKNNNLEIDKVYEVKNHSTEKKLTINEFLAETIQTEDSSNVFYFKSNCLENETDSKICDIYFIDTNTDINLDKRKIITDFEFKDKSDNRILETVAISTESYQSVYSYGTKSYKATSESGIFRAIGIQPEGCINHQDALINPKCKLVQFTHIDPSHNSVEFIELPDAGVCARTSNNPKNHEVIQGFNTSGNCSDLFNNNNEILKLGEKINIYYDIKNENYKETTGYKNFEKFRQFVRFEGANLYQSYLYQNGIILFHYYEPVTIWKKIEFAEP